MGAIKRGEIWTLPRHELNTPAATHRIFSVSPAFQDDTRIDISEYILTQRAFRRPLGRTRPSLEAGRGSHEVGTTGQPPGRRGSRDEARGAVSWRRTQAWSRLRG